VNKTNKNKIFYQDFRFFIKAENIHEASEIILNKIPDTDNELYCYTPINIIDEFKGDPMKWNPLKEDKIEGGE